MEEENKHSPKDEREIEQEPPKANAEEEAKPEAAPAPAPKTGWGGWGFSPLTVLSDLQKAAEEISRNVRILLLTFPLFFYLLYLFFYFSNDRLAPVSFVSILACQG